MPDRKETNRIIIHCSATHPKLDIGVKDIDSWHKAKGWSGCGYHYVLRRDGTEEIGRPYHQIGAHTMSHNEDSIGICVVGGVDAYNNPEFNFTKVQMDALYSLVTSLRHLTGASVHGHNEFSSKACPSLNVQEYFK